MKKQSAATVESGRPSPVATLEASPPLCPICGDPITIRDGINVHCKQGHQLRDPATIEPNWWPKDEADYAAKLGPKEQAERLAAEAEAEKSKPAE